MDWVLVVDGDERMLEEDTAKIVSTINANQNCDMIWLPRCHYQDWGMVNVEYGSMDKVGSDWREAIRINPDWQPRLIKRTIIDGKSKVQYERRVHETVKGVGAQLRNLNSPVIRHLGWMKTDDKKAAVAALCDTLWQADKENKEIFDTYVLENAAGTATASNPWNKEKTSE